MSYISFSYDQTSYDAVVIDVKDNYYLVSSKLERLYVYEKDNQKEIGDIIHLEGKKKELSFTIIESGFDFTDYLNKKGVNYQFEVKKEEYREVIALLKRGYSVRNTAKLTGKGISTVQRIKKEFVD